MSHNRFDAPAISYRLVFGSIRNNFGKYSEISRRLIGASADKNSVFLLIGVVSAKFTSKLKSSGQSVELLGFEEVGKASVTNRDSADHLTDYGRLSIHR